jgi:WD40 repeat protein
MGACASTSSVRVTPTATAAIRSDAAVTTGHQVLAAINSDAADTAGHQVSAAIISDAVGTTGHQVPDAINSDAADTDGHQVPAAINSDTADTDGHQVSAAIISNASTAPDAPDTSECQGSRCKVPAVKTAGEEEGVEITRFEGTPSGSRGPASAHRAKDPNKIHGQKRCSLWSEDRRDRDGWKERLHRRNRDAEEEDEDNVLAACIGDLERVTADSRGKRMVRFFVSSTFTDTFFERNWMLEDCMPFLKEAARNRGLDIVFSEMRFGIREEATKSGRTSEICMRELKRCLEESSGLAYLLIAGDKYGFRPPPRTIPKSEFEEICSHLLDDEQLVRSFYNLDTNALTDDGDSAPEYVIVNQDEKADFWDNYNSLQHAFRDAAHRMWSSEIVERELKNPRSSHPSIKYVVSVTHEEVRHGIFANNTIEGTVYVVRRRFEGLHQLQPGSDPIVKDFVDTKVSGGQYSIDYEAVNLNWQLMDETIPSCLSTCKLVPFKKFNFLPFIPHRGLDCTIHEHSQYMRELLDDLCRHLLDSLDNTQDKFNKKPNMLFEECNHHLKFCSFRASRYFATRSSSHVLSQVDSYLKGPGGDAFVLWGSSGAGKTYIMAKIAQSISAQASASALVVRFCGTSQNSFEVHKLLLTLCEQMIFIKKRHINASHSSPTSCPKDFQSLCDLFQELIRDWTVCPLFLLLDSVDQLNDSNGGRRLQWLPVESNMLSVRVRLVISTLPDGESFGKKFQCLSYLRKRICSKSHFAMVEPLTDGSQLLQYLLKLQKRCLTQQQINSVMQVANQSDQTQTPLFLTILANETSSWQSFSRIPHISPSVKLLILGFFNSLANSHGHRLVNQTICLLTLAKDGLSETELQELLSLDDETLLEQYEWWVPPEHVLPAAPFTMLITALMPFLSHRGQDFSGELVFWYHRAFWETALENFLCDIELRKQVHFQLGSYFRGEWAARKKPYSEELKKRIQKVYPGEKSADRRVRNQPFSIGGSVFGQGVIINVRRCSCAGFHMIQGSMVYESFMELTNFEGIVARVLCGEGFNLVTHFVEWLKMSEMSQTKTEQMQHFLRWITPNLHRFIRFDYTQIAQVHRLEVDYAQLAQVSEIIVSLLKEPEASLAKRAYLDFHDRSFTVPSDLQTLGSQRENVINWLPRRVLGSTDCFESLSLTLRGNGLPLNSVSWSPDGLMMASGSCDHTVALWETSTGERVHKMEGHTDWVRCVSFSPHGDQIASSSVDKTVIIWDFESLDNIAVLKGHGGSSCSGDVYAVKWSKAGDKLASCASDKVVIIWDVASWDQIQALKGHSDSVRDLVWSDDSLISCSFDQSIILWDTVTWRQKSRLFWRSKVSCVCISPDGKNLASGSLDGAVVLWDLETFTFSPLVGHKTDVNGVAWRPDSSVHLASSGWDGLIILWNVKTGEKIVTFSEGRSMDWFNPLRGLWWDHTGSKISSCCFDKVYIWDVPSQKLDQNWPTATGHTGSVRCLSWNKDGDKICSCSNDSTIKIWDTSKGTEIGTLRGQGGWVESVSWSPNGEKVAACSQDDRTCTIWDVTSFTLVRTLGCQTDHTISQPASSSSSLHFFSLGPACCSWISCALLAASIESTNILIWDSSTGDLMATLLGHSGIVKSLKFCLSRNLLASGSMDNCIRVSQIESEMSSLRHSHHVTLRGHAGGVDSLDWTMNGDRLASASADESIIIWDCHTWTQLAALKGPWHGMRSVSFSPAGDQLANIGHDGTLFIWDTSTYKVITTLRSRGGGASVQYSPRGTQIANGYYDGSIVIWDRELVVNYVTHSEFDVAETKHESVWNPKEASVSSWQARCALAEAQPADTTTSTQHVITHTHTHTQSSSGGEPFPEPAGQPVSIISEQFQDKGKDDKYQTVTSNNIPSSLLLHCHELSQDEASTLVGSLTLGRSTLTSLSLFGLQSSQEKLFLQEVLNLTQLRSLSIVNSTFESGSALLKSRITKVMEGLGSLQDLDLERNCLGPIGATGVAVPLTRLSLLRRLRLGHNNMEDTGGKTIATSIRQLSLLTELNLEDNFLTPEGVTAIISTLAPLTAIRKLAFKDSLVTTSSVDPAHLARYVSNVEITIIPQTIVNAFEPAGVPEMRFKHGIRGNMPHSLAITFEIEGHDLDSGLPPYLGRLWLAWMGSPDNGSAHWIFSDSKCPLQFGVWGGAQITSPCEEVITEIFSIRHLMTLVTVHDGISYSLFCNGKEVGRIPARFDLPANGQLAVGDAARVDGCLFRGKVYGVQVWDVSLSQNDVRLATLAIAARVPRP